MGRTEYWNDTDAPKPNSLVPACGVLAVDEAGRILLQRRRDTGQWALPMGKMELGETPSQCAIRETPRRPASPWPSPGSSASTPTPPIGSAYTDGEVRQEYELMFTGRRVVCRPSANQAQHGAPRQIPHRSLVTGRSDYYAGLLGVSSQLPEWRAALRAPCRRPGGASSSILTGRPGRPG